MPLTRGMMPGRATAAAQVAPVDAVRQRHVLGEAGQGCQGLSSPVAGRRVFVFVTAVRVCGNQ